MPQLITTHNQLYLCKLHTTATNHQVHWLKTIISIMSVMLQEHLKWSCMIEVWSTNTQRPHTLQLQAVICAEAFTTHISCLLWNTCTKRGAAVLMQVKTAVILCTEAPFSIWRLMKVNKDQNADRWRLKDTFGEALRTRLGIRSGFQSKIG